MRGSAFCYHHGRRIPPARKASSTEHRIEIPANLDPNGIAQGISSVLRNLADGRISARRASVLLWGMGTVAKRPANCESAPAAPTPVWLIANLIALIDDSDDEAVTLINKLAARLGLDSPDAPPELTGAKR